MNWWSQLIEDSCLAQEMFGEDELERWAKMRFKIWGVYKDGEPEVIDEFETMEDAQSNLEEYRVAFSNSWRLWIADIMRPERPFGCGEGSRAWIEADRTK